MNGKNLLLKFLLGVMLPVVVCLGSLFMGGGLKFGIDLRGGHSLIFEIRTDEREIDRLDVEKDEEEKNLQTAEAEGDKQKVKETEEKIAKIESKRKRLEDQKSGGNLAEEIIRILKERIDPEGLRSLEWRPLSNNRIEVRMPAASGETEKTRDAYDRARDALAAANLRRGDIRKVCRATRTDRDALVRRLAGGNKDLAERLGEVAQAWKVHEDSRDKLASAKAAYEKARDAGKPAAELEKLKKALDEARNNWATAAADYGDKFKTTLRAGAVDMQRLDVVLANYIPDSQADVLKKNPDEYKKRTEKFDEGRETLRKNHPAKMAEIDKVIVLYQKWSQQRQRLEDPADLKRLIAKAGVLEFRIAPRRPGAKDAQLTAEEVKQYKKNLNEEGPEGLRRRYARCLWFRVRGDRSDFPGLVTAEYAGSDYILLYDEPGLVMLSDRGLGGWALTDARRSTDTFSRLAIGFTFNEGGAKRMARLTADNIKRPLAILLDNEVYSAPNINDIISARGIITGRFTPQEVDDLVRTLIAGSLPARLNPEPVAENSFGPAIGEVNRRMGIKAAYWGLIVVAAFMFLYYLMSGIIANVALLLNIILVLGAMSLLSAVFTLPGIAGVILTIGIAVDANVLIFERLREEQVKSQSIAMAIKNAYERAFSAIFDANITTLIVCLILGWVGTEEIRGFAITLGLGVMFSMFTSLVVTRWIFQFLVKAKLLTKPVFMLRVIGVPKINWIRKRYLFWTLSIVLMVMGIASLIWQGGDIWGIEFSAGTQAVVKFRDDALIDGKLPDDGLVRAKFDEKAAALGFDRLAATARVEKRKNPDRVKMFLEPHDTNKDRKVSREEWKSGGMNVDFFPLADTNGDGVLATEEILNLPAREYQISTTETQLSRIRQTAREAFGESLSRRTAMDFTLVKGGGHKVLGVDLADDGWTRIEDFEHSSEGDLLEEYEAGVLFVIDLTQPLAETEVRKRIREMRSKPDFGSQQGRFEVIGLKPAGEKDRYLSFAILVGPSDVSIRAGGRAWNEFAEKEFELLNAAMKQEDPMEVLNFDAAIAGEAKQLAIVAVVLSCLAIVAYLWLRFGSVQWGLAAVICLVHDVIIVVGLVAISGWFRNTPVGRALGIGDFKIDLAMVAAILTVIGYSVNDTIVVFDRIRENRGKLTAVSPQIINASINQTLGRTLLTSGTTFIVVLIMYVWGGPGIHSFSYALLVGVLFGTYSSVAVASPLLMGFKKALVVNAAAVATE